MEDVKAIRSFGDIRLDGLPSSVAELDWVSRTARILPNMAMLLLNACVGQLESSLKCVASMSIAFPVIAHEAGCPRAPPSRSRSRHRTTAGKQRHREPLHGSVWGNVYSLGFVTRLLRTLRRLRRFRI
jgi:hypothetical protein